MVTQIKTETVCGYKKQLMFCFWSKIYLENFFFLNAERRKKSKPVKVKHIKGDGCKKTTHMLYIIYDFLPLLCLPSER